MYFNKQQRFLTNYKKMSHFTSIKTKLYNRETIETSLSDLIELVQQTIDDFRDKPCQIGRARIFQDKSIGLDDPGMVAFKRLLEGLDSN